MKITRLATKLKPKMKKTVVNRKCVKILRSIQSMRNKPQTLNSLTSSFSHVGRRRLTSCGPHNYRNQWLEAG